MITKNLKICTWNVCLGAKYKKHHIKNLLEEHAIDILCIQEAEIKYDDDPSWLAIQGYSVEVEKGIQYEKCRTMLYVKNSIKYTRQFQTEKPGSHVMLLRIECENKVISLASIYRTYKLTGHVSHMQAFQEQVEILQEFMNANRGDDCIIMGDMNLDERRRSDRSYNLHQLYQIWDEFEKEQNLIQMVKFSTWTRLHGQTLRQSIIDHVYVDNQALVEYVEEISVTIGDHVPVLISLVCKTKTEKRTVYIRNWKNYSKENLELELSKEDWNIMANCPEDYSNILENKLLDVLEQVIPYEYKNNRGGWYPDSEKLVKLKRKRKNLFLNAKRRGDGGRLQRCKALDKKINALQKKGCWNGVRKKILEGGQQGLWKGLRLAQSKPVEPIPKELKNGTEVFVTPGHQAQAFANYFRTKVEKVVEENQINHHVNNGTRLVVCSSQNFFTLELVREIMLDLKYKPCFGSDRIPLKVLKDGVDFLAQPILELMNLIYAQKNVPEQWKISRIIPLHKKGPRTNIENYRPIANLCSTSKIFEKAILARIMQIEKDNNVDLTGATHHGFKKKKSTVTAALQLQTKIARACDEKKYVAVASLDLSSAFDVINVDLLLMRLSIMGLPDDLVLLLRSWLKNRSAYVEVDGECSEFFDVPNGSVQGSSLGPVLFNLFVAPNTESEMSYADDGFYVAVHEDRTEALKKLEEKLIRAEQWLSGSGLKVNASKTELVIFHKHDSARGSISLSQTRIDSKAEMKVLGIIFDNQLEWSGQVEKSVQSARQATQALGLVRKYFSNGEMSKLITALVYSRLYYAAQVWLLPNLKKRLMDRLYSQSGRSLKLIDRFSTYKQLHCDYNRATPMLYSQFLTSVLYFDIMNSDFMLPEVEFVTANTLTNRRNKNIVFTSSNSCRIGMNIPSNRLRSVTNMIEKDWMGIGKDSFKLKAKIHIIQNGLELWKYLS